MARTTTNGEISESDLVELGAAKRLLENPGLTIKLTNLLGTPIEKGLQMLPDVANQKIQAATKSALHGCLKTALKTMSGKETESYPWWHKAAAVVSGSVGGAFGLPALVAELPISTSIIMRSIADIGRAHGEDLGTLEAQMNCLLVFALGGKATDDDHSKLAYFAARVALAKAVAEAVEVSTGKVIVDEAAPAILRLIALVASRFQIQVSEKAAAQAVPIVGAIGGGAINYLFLDHFQDMSNGHFAVRKLERKYGAEAVRIAYEKLPA
jgi:hypothetical protein